MLHLSKKEVEMEKYELCVLCTLFIQKLLSDTFSSNASYCSVWPEMSIINESLHTSNRQFLDIKVHAESYEPLFTMVGT